MEFTTIIRTIIRAINSHTSTTATNVDWALSQRGRYPIVRQMLKTKFITSRRRSDDIAINQTSQLNNAKEKLLDCNRMLTPWGESLKTLRLSRRAIALMRSHIKVIQKSAVLSRGEFEQRTNRAVARVNGQHWKWEKIFQFLFLFFAVHPFFPFHRCARSLRYCVMVA